MNDIEWLEQQALYAMGQPYLTSDYWFKLALKAEQDGRLFIEQDLLEQAVRMERKD